MKGEVAGMCHSDLIIEQLAFCIARGGWPASIGVDEDPALRCVYDYVEAVINNDVSRVDSLEKSPSRVRALLRSLARNVSTTASMKTIIDDITANEQSISETTINSYLNALRRIFVVEDLPAWSPALSSKTAIRLTAKRHFVDPSIAVTALRTAPEGLLADFNTFGLFLGRSASETFASTHKLMMATYTTTAIKVTLKPTS